MQAVSASEFLSLSRSYPVIDVRTPAEFQQGHIPGSINIPLFTNEDRVIIGTLYKLQGKEAAMLKGMELAAPRFVKYIRKAGEVAIDGTLLLHCWRGGMRSAGMAWLFEWYGYKVYTLQKGYKAFRNMVLETFERQFKLKVLAGKTGSGKSLVLKELEKMGELVLDLEKIVHHKGSAFGVLGEQPQPTQEMFENECAVSLLGMPPGRPVWVEDESQNIGKRIIPNSFFAQMRTADVFYIDVPFENRVNYLCGEYGKYSELELIECVEKIRKRLGNQHAKAAIEAIREGDVKKACEISLVYYDKSYNHGVAKRTPSSIRKLEFNEIAPEKIADTIQKLT